MNEQSQNWITVRMTAHIIGCSMMTVHRLCRKGELTDYRLSQRGWRRVSYASLQAYMKKISGKGTGR